MPALRHGESTIGAMRFKVTRTVPSELRGLGDVVHAIALPVAKKIDWAFKTHWVECKECEKRREQLNRLVPLK